MKTHGLENFTSVVRPIGVYYQYVLKNYCEKINSVFLQKKDPPPPPPGD
jgi:hypothetical protein